MIVNKNIDKKVFYFYLDNASWNKSAELYKALLCIEIM